MGRGPLFYLAACPFGAAGLLHIMSHQSDLVRPLSETIRPLVESLGFDLVRVKITGGRKKTVQIMAERPDGSIDVGDCAEISRAVSALLDVEGPIEGDYMLEVSSPGIDRPLVRLKDFDRFEGHLAKVEMARPIDGRKTFVGRLLGLASDNIRLELEDGKNGRQRVSLPFSFIAHAQLVMTDELIRDSMKSA